MSEIKNIIIFVVIITALVLIYIFFIKPSSSDQSNLVSSSGASLPNVNGLSSETNAQNTSSLMTKDFLALLLNVKNIKLDDAILSDPAFSSLRDSSIILVPDGTEGRPNPFAQFGNDAVPVSTGAHSSSSSSSTSTTPVPAKQ
jgi:preprotein translocase subunit SecG